MVSSKKATIVGVDGTSFTFHLTTAGGGLLPENAIAMFTLEEKNRNMMLVSGLLKEGEGDVGIEFDSVEDEDLVMPFFGESLPDLASAIYAAHQHLFGR